MYPIGRTIATFIRGSRASKLDLNETSETPFVCRPWDIDLFFEMNNGRILTLYDLGRFELAMRTGLHKALQNNNWGLVVAGSTIRYRKRIRMFDKVTMKTRMAGMDDRWIYLIQSMWVKGEPCSSVLLRTGVTEKGRTIPVERIIAATGHDLGEIDEMPVWVKEWIAAESHRTWPPEA